MHGAFRIGRLLIIDSVSLIDTGILRLCLLVRVLADCAFQGIYQINGHTVAHSIP